MKKPILSLPEPSTIEIEHQQKVISHLKERMLQNHNRLSFKSFMQEALYAPGLGYYSAGKIKFAHAGDFVTAPIISSLFSQCLAKQCQQVLELMPNAAILEFGAGTGIMAADILLMLEASNALPTHYYILEVSPDLKDIQQKTLQNKCPHLYKYVSWLEQLPKPGFTGIILANEVLDAFAVHKFCIKNNKIFEYYVTFENNQFNFILDEPATTLLKNKILALAEDYSIPPDKYESEINLHIEPWLNSLSDILARGLILLIDYGFPGREYYHPHRHMGTLMCHYKHRAHSNPLILVGLQDITAHIDFTLVAKAGFKAGFEVAGYTNQASFLINCGLAEFARINNDPTCVINRNKEIKLLTLPQEMGELFKVSALTKNLNLRLLGFNQFNKLHQL